MPSSKRLFLASRVGAFVHAIASTALCLVVAREMVPLMDASARSTGAPLVYDQERAYAWDWVLEHSIGYFVNDLCYCCLFEPDMLFIVHHVGYLCGTVPLRLAPRR